MILIRNMKKIIISLFLVASCSGNEKLSILEKEADINFNNKLELVYSTNYHNKFISDGGFLDIYFCKRINISKDSLVKLGFKSHIFDKNMFFRDSQLIIPNKYYFRKGFVKIIDDKIGTEKNEYSEIWINETMDTIIYKKLYM